MSDMVLPTFRSHEIQASLRCSSIASLRAVISDDVSTNSTDGYLLLRAHERVHDDRKIVCLLSVFAVQLYFSRSLPFGLAPAPSFHQILESRIGVNCVMSLHGVGILIIGFGSSFDGTVSALLKYDMNLAEECLFNID